MTKASWQINNVNTSKRPEKNIKRLRLSSNIAIVLLCSLFISCSHTFIEKKEPEWIYPPDNPFPSIFKIRKYKDQKIGLVAKLKPKTIKVSCRLRSDSPYYWCDFEGELVSPDPKLPKKINSTFHVVVSETGKKTALNFVTRARKKYAPVVIVLEMRASITDMDNSIYSQLFGAYNAEECFDVFEDYSLCPKKTKKLDIFTGKYIN